MTPLSDRVSAVRVSASEALCATAILDLDANDRPPPLPAADAPARQLGANPSDLPPAGWGDSVVILGFGNFTSQNGNFADTI